ncbi:MAG: LysR family transcriptional regulator [Hyphomicrobiales bacterium]|nr:MAG: LysR family transcriptional regulator [Hyphomicrobiales bacterium]
MNLKSLRVFVHVIDEGTLARASEHLHLSQPAASRLLSILEQELGIALFYREKKRLIPTPEGSLFYSEAVRILASIDGIPSFFDQIRKDAAVPLRVVCHSRIVSGLVLPAIARLSRRNAGLKIRLEVHPRRDLARRIGQGLYDIGIGAFPLSSDEVDQMFLCRAPIHVIVPKHHPLAAHEVLTTSQLQDHPYIAIDRNTIIRRIVDRELQKEGLELDPLHEVSVGWAAYRLVQEGIGFTFADPVAVEENLMSELCFVPWARKAAIEFGVFLPKTRRRHHAVEEFIACIRETADRAIPMPKEPGPDRFN